MWQFLRRRFVFFFFTFVLTSLMIFFMLRILPGDAARMIAGGREASEEQVTEIRERLGLDRPLLQQYIDWGTNFLQGNWGDSTALRGETNFDLIMGRLRNSARLAFISLMMSIPLSLLLGIIAGLTEDQLPDTIISILTLSVVSLPEFVTGLFLINVVALQWANNPLAGALNWWFPSSSAVPVDAPFEDILPHLWLPAIAATLVLLAYITRLVRAGVIEELHRDYVRTAFLKGLPYRRVIIGHVLRNALLPTITVIAISTTWLISGLVVIETVFGYPGLGSLLITAIERRDLLLVQGLVMVIVTIILITNMLADMAYTILNPRIQLS